ncbi:MAG: hypothetical protein QY331_06165 [Melioribacteraceae bacterium]|nr:MAG: hypothetical protein QY331_06165 [Melioribacteraceae bacterium]
MKYIFTVILFFSLFQAQISSQENVIAEIADEFLTVDEFVKRFELTPRIHSSFDVDSQKVHFLHTLIAEKLWAKEAHNLQLDTNYSFNQYVKNLEKQLVRDALFKREIEEKSTISNQEFNAALQKCRYELRFNFLFSKSKTEIDSLYSLLAFTSIDSLLINRPERVEQPEPIPLLFGQMQESIEDSLFRLNIGEYSEPIYSEIGWVIYYLKDKIELTAERLGTKEKLDSSINKILEERKKKELLSNYLRELLSDKNVNTDRDLFELLSQKLSDRLTEKFVDQINDFYILYESDINKIIKDISSQEKSKDIIKFTMNPISLNEFLHYLLFINFKSSGTDLNSVRVALNSDLREFIKNEFVAREAYKLNIDALPEIQDELKMWKDNYLAQLLRNTYNKKIVISEREIEEHMSSLLDSTITTKFVDLTEIKLSNLNQAQYVLTQSETGKEFEDIISELNLPEQMIVRSDSMQPINIFGSLIDIIDNLEVDEIYGPIVKAEGYSIIKLNAVEEKTLSSIDKNKLQVDLQRELLYYKKLNKLITDETVELAKKYDLKVNESTLIPIKVTEVPTLIYRLYGFGGQSTAAPFLNLFYEWYFQYKNEIQNPL